MSKGFLVFLIVISTCQVAPEHQQKPTASLEDIPNFLEERRLQWQSACGDELYLSADQLPAAEVYPLTGDEALVMVVCSRGIYQGSQVFFWVEYASDPDTVKRLDFEQFAESETEAPFFSFTDSLVYGTVIFETEKAVLHILNRYRGAGDCGTRTSYSFRGGEPKIIQFKAWPSCEQPNQDVTRWPVVPTEVRRTWPKGENPLR